MRFREGTWDKDIFNAVYRRNEYRLPQTVPGNWSVLDVGMHIGAFSMLALDRGAGWVVGFEAVPANFQVASENLRAYGERFSGHCEAVWRSDIECDFLEFTEGEEKENTGGYTCLGGSSKNRVPCVPFDNVILGMSHVDLVKLDCEGSEWPILLTSKQLGLIDRIVGEFHEYGGKFSNLIIPDNACVNGAKFYTKEVLVNHLERAGFKVKTERNPDNQKIGLFWAER